MKRVFIVAGPESSGTRLVGKILVALGCAAPEVMRTWDYWLPTAENPAVIRWSFPHAKKWPDVVKTRETLQGRGYAVKQVITMRDYNAMIRSQVIHRHVGEGRQARKNIAEAYRRLFASAVDCPVLVNYDSMVRRPQAFVAWLSGELGLTGKVDIDITDQTGKHYRGK